MAETRQTGDKRNRTNPGKFGRNRTNRAKLGKNGQKRAINRNFHAKTGKKTGEIGRNWAKPVKNGQKRSKSGRTKPNPGKTGRNRKFCRILVRVRSSLLLTNRGSLIELHIGLHIKFAEDVEEVEGGVK